MVIDAVPLPDFNDHSADTHDICHGSLTNQGQFGVVVELEDGFLALAILIPPDQVVNGLQMVIV